MATMKTLNGYGFNATEFNGKTSDSYLLKTDTAANSANSQKLGGKAPEYYIQPRNLLDNSDFRNPVNQRGQTSYTEYGYTIDRWKNSHSFQVSVNAGSITVAGAKSYHHFMQAIEKYSFLVGKTVTLAIRCKGVSGGTAGLAMIDSSDTVYGNTQHTLTGGWQTIVETVTIPGEISTTSLWFSVYTASALDMEWAALYEGSYTADTLPPYVPKGYAAELAECQRYFYSMTSYWKFISAGICTSTTKCKIPIQIPQAMRIKPTVTIADKSLVKIKAGSVDIQVPSEVSWTNATRIYDILYMECTITGATNGDIAMLYFDDGGRIDFSADL